VNNLDATLFADVIEDITPILVGGAAAGLGLGILVYGARSAWKLVKGFGRG